MAVICNESGERYVYTGDANFVIPTTGTLSLWMKPTWVQADNAWHFFFGHRTDDNNIFSAEKFSDNNLYWGWKTGGVDHRVAVLNANYTINQNQWNHFALTWDDSANETKLYLNGTEIGTQVATLTTFSATNPTIGSRGDDPSNMEGSIAEVAVWSRVLAADELAALNKRVSAAAMSRSLYTYDPMIRNDSLNGSEFVFRPRMGAWSAVSAAKLEHNFGTTNTLDAHPPIIYPTTAWAVGSLASVDLPDFRDAARVYYKVPAWPARKSPRVVRSDQQSFTDSSAPPLVLQHDNRIYPIKIWPRRVSSWQVKSYFNSFIDPAGMGFTAHWQPVNVRVKSRRMFQSFWINATSVNTAPLSGGGVGPVTPPGDYAQWAPDPVVKFEPKRAGIRLRAPMNPKLGTKTRPC